MALVRYYLPFDNDNSLKYFFMNKVENKEIIVLGKVAIESKRNDKGIIIKNLEFIPGRHFITDDSKPELIKLLNVLKERPTLKIDIHGHVCCTTKSMDGFDIDTERNNLSKTRAKFVYDYLVEEGIEEDRLSYRGFGGTQPAYPETNDENRQKNRRVEIVLLEK